MKAVDRQWWFVALVGALTVLATRYLLVAAGLPATPHSAAQFAVYLLCFIGVWKAFAFALWLLALRWLVPARA
jgi:hypothetical protein